RGTTTCIDLGPTAPRPGERSRALSSRRLSLCCRCATRSSGSALPALPWRHMRHAVPAGRPIESGTDYRVPTEGEAQAESEGEGPPPGSGAVARARPHLRFRLSVEGKRDLDTRIVDRPA